MTPLDILNARNRVHTLPPGMPNVITHIQVPLPNMRVYRTPIDIIRGRTQTVIGDLLPMTATTTKAKGSDVDGRMNETDDQYAQAFQKKAIDAGEYATWTDFVSRWRAWYADNIAGAMLILNPDTTYTQAEQYDTDRYNFYMALRKEAPAYTPGPAPTPPPVPGEDVKTKLPEVPPGTAATISAVAIGGAVIAVVLLLKK